MAHRARSALALGMTIGLVIPENLRGFFYSLILSLSKDARLARRSKAFAFGEFISLVSPTAHAGACANGVAGPGGASAMDGASQETNQRKRFPRQIKPIVSFLRAIPALGILPRAGTACIHARRPAGLDCIAIFLGALKVQCLRSRLKISNRFRDS